MGNNFMCILFLDYFFVSSSSFYFWGRRAQGGRWCEWDLYFVDLVPTLSLQFIGHHFMVKFVAWNWWKCKLAARTRTLIRSLAHMHSAHTHSISLSFPQLLLPHFFFSFLLKTHSTRNSRTINNKALVVKTFIAYYVHSYWICIYAMLLCSMRRNFFHSASFSFRSLSPFVRRRDASSVHNCKFSNLFSLNYRFVPRLILQFFILSFEMSPLCSMRFAVVSRIVSWIRNEPIAECIRILYKLLLYFRYLFASSSPLLPCFINYFA